MQSLRIFFVLALLKKTTFSRIVIVASDLYKLAKLNLAKPNPTNQLPAYLYYVSKYANIMFSMELARKLKNSNSGDYPRSRRHTATDNNYVKYYFRSTGVTCNCLHPGLIDSGIWRNVPFPLNYGLQLIVKTMFKVCVIHISIYHIWKYLKQMANHITTVAQLHV